LETADRGDACRTWISSPGHPDVVVIDISLSGLDEEAANRFAARSTTTDGERSEGDLKPPSYMVVEGVREDALRVAPRAGTRWRSSVHVIIIGGGTGGMCLARGLRRAGISVAVYERYRTRTDSLHGYL
jgi:NADPH-dependent 2,4-dienoyl-CoA reductase/sulfur reductase-like enzyme